MKSLDSILPEPPAVTSGLVTMPAAEYHADPCDTPSLSSSIIKLLVNATPAHARLEHPRLNPNYQEANEERFDLGTVAHELLLEGATDVCVIDAPDWRTRAAQEQRDQARLNGQTPLLVKDWERVDAMVVAARRQLEMYDEDPALLTDGLPEQTLLWQEGGVWCRARYDWIRTDLRAVDDLKTTAASADPRKWGRTMLTIGADLQAAFYLRGLKKAFDAEPVWRFIVQETFKPYALSVVTLSDDLLAHANRRVDQAIELWKRCLDDNHWPGYSRNPQVIDLPPWMTGTAASPVLLGDALTRPEDTVPF